MSSRAVQPLLTACSTCGRAHTSAPLSSPRPAHCVHASVPYVSQQTTSTQSDERAGPGLKEKKSASEPPTVVGNVRNPSIILPQGESHPGS